MKAEHTRKIMLDIAPLEAHVNITMWKMMNNELAELERLATIGRATEKALDCGNLSLWEWITENHCSDSPSRYPREIKCFQTVKELIKWAKEDK